MQKRTLFFLGYIPKKNSLGLFLLTFSKYLNLVLNCSYGWTNQIWHYKLPRAENMKWIQCLSMHT